MEISLDVNSLSRLDDGVHFSILRSQDYEKRLESLQDAYIRGLFACLSAYQHFLYSSTMKLSLAIQALFTFLSHALQADMESTDKDGLSSMQSILNQANTSELYQYPTDLTQDIIPVREVYSNQWPAIIPIF